MRIGNAVLLLSSVAVGITIGLLKPSITAPVRPVMHATYNNETGMTISGVCPPHMTPQSNKMFPTTLDQALNATCVWVTSAPQSVTLLHWIPENKAPTTFYGKLHP